MIPHKGNQAHITETFCFNPLQFKTCLNYPISCKQSIDSTSICEVDIILENISLHLLVTYHLPLSLLDYQLLDTPHFDQGLHLFVFMASPHQVPSSFTFILHLHHFWSPFPIFKSPIATSSWFMIGMHPCQ